MLNETQQRFLEKFINSRGNQYEALEQLGMDLCHLIFWRENTEFELAFRNAQHKLLIHLRQESFILANKRINEGIKNGITQESLTQEHIISDDSNTYKVKKTIKNLGVPIGYLKLAMTETAIAKAIQTLANEGALPMTIAKKIIQRAETISSELAESFEIQEDETAISEAKIIAYIKAAVLNSDDE